MTWMFFSIFILGILLLGIFDVLLYTIPNKIVFPLLLLGVMYQLILGDIKVMGLGLLISFLIGFFVWVLGGMGGGDVKLMATIGVWLGYENFIVITFIACFLGILWSIVDFIRQKRLLNKTKDILMKIKMFKFIGFKSLDVKNQDLKKPIPFGSCLALSTIIILIA